MSATGLRVAASPLSVLRLLLAACLLAALAAVAAADTPLGSRARCPYISTERAVTDQIKITEHRCVCSGARCGRCQQLWMKMNIGAGMWARVPSGCVWTEANDE